VNVGSAPRYVAVVGPDEPPPGDQGARLLAEAEAVGAELAARGAVVVCGGLGGVMEAASRGARAAGGTTVGILPGLDRADGNRHLEVAIPTGLGEARNALVVRAADAVIAVGGGFGTLAEIALALKAGKPVVGIDTWELPHAATLGRAPEAAADAAEAVERALAG
jgi:hypothetical protein